MQGGGNEGRQRGQPRRQQQAPPRQLGHGEAAAVPGGVLIRICEAPQHAHHHLIRQHLWRRMALYKLINPSQQEHYNQGDAIVTFDSHTLGRRAAMRPMPLAALQRTTVSWSHSPSSSSPTAALT